DFAGQLERVTNEALELIGIARPITAAAILALTLDRNRPFHDLVHDIRARFAGFVHTALDRDPRPHLKLAGTLREDDGARRQGAGNGQRDDDRRKNSHAASVNVGPAGSLSPIAQRASKEPRSAPPFR